MGLSADDIRSHEFPMRRRGYDPDAVREFLAEIAAGLPSTDPFDEAGRQVAQVLRSAHDEASRIRSTAEAEAESVRTEAELRAAEVRAEAEEEQEKAKRLLVRARERADSVVAEAEERAAGLVTNAESQARSRVTAILEAGRQRLDNLTREEQTAQRRLLDAQAELQGIISRITGPETRVEPPGPEPVIDLTSDEARVHWPGAPAVEPHAAESATTGESAAPSPATEMSESDEGEPEVFREDPLTRMVRRAVDRAAAEGTNVPRNNSARRHELDDEPDPRHH